MSITVSEFLKALSTPLHHKQPEYAGKPWVFWSQNNSASDHGNPVIHEKIKTAVSNIELFVPFLAQFWAPVTIGCRRLLSTSGQPFAVSYLSNEIAMCRLSSEKYEYNIDVNKLDAEPDPKIINGGPATAFLNHLPYIIQLHWDPSESDAAGRWKFSVMLPICFPSQSHCIGVLEFITYLVRYDLGRILLDTIAGLKKDGLVVFPVQEVIPYKTINDLKPAKDEIEEALKIVCESHNLALAQVWIALEDAQTKSLLALKLTGCFYAIKVMGYADLRKYYSLCDVIPWGKFALRTLQDHEPRYISKLRHDMLVDWEEHFSDNSALAIYLRSNDTGDFGYAFEFVWPKHSRFANLLEAILLTLKRCLPSFKFASGAELGDELYVIDVETSTYSEDDEIRKFKIFRGKRSSSLMPKPMDEGTKPLTLDYVAPSEVTCKTTQKVLPREVIEKQFGNTMKDAAKNLNVSESTLKRKLRKHGIREWPGPNFVKRNSNDSSTIQIGTNEEDTGAVREPSTISINKNVVTIKAQYADDIIKFRLPTLQASFVGIEKEIGMRFKLSFGTYKLKYRDVTGDMILLTSDEEMSYCIESSRKSPLYEVRLLVLPSPHN